MCRHAVRSLLITQTIVLLTLLAACGKEQAAVDRVGVNAVDKNLFEGSWYFSRTVIDVDYEGGALGTFPGDAAVDFQGSDLASIPRIRWVIDEDALYAYRDYELLEGGNPVDPASPLPADVQVQRPNAEQLRNTPVAAFEIEKHFDIRRAYNTQTGEELNVVEENDTDRPWYERDFMRVDWSKNLLPAYYGQTQDLFAIIGLFERQQASLFVQGESEFPDSWRPRFHFMQCDGQADEAEPCTGDERTWASDYDKDQLYAFDFVTQELLAPGEVVDPFTRSLTNWCLSAFIDAPACTTAAAYVRNSFLRVSDKRQYEPVNWVDTRFERAGYFRLERPTFDRTTAADDPAFGRTDFLNYNINRHNIWYNWYEESENASGELVREPVPMADRRVRPIVFHTTPELPAHLVEPSFEVSGRWNEIYMQMVRNLQGRDDAVYPEVVCQNENPDAYCACIIDPDTGETLNPTCPGQYDPFETPDAARARGVENPYDCHVEVPEGAQPSLERPDLNDSHFYGWYGARQVGSECVIDLRINTCNRASIEENDGTVDGMECQERGDARFKFLSYVNQPGTGFLGIATLRGDPVTGEIMVGDANIGGPSLDSYRTTALQMYDLINGDLGEQEFLTGEDIRSYLENLNRVQLPARPRIDFNIALEHDTALPADIQAVNNKMNAFVARAANLEGAAGRINTFVDRRAALAGTPTERRIMESLETLALTGIDVLPTGYGPGDLSEEMLDRISPFRISAHQQLRDDLELENAIAMNNVYMPNEFIDNSVLSFVNQHRDWPRARLEIGLNQLLYFQTQLHELGHCLGLRHDMAGSTDIDNYDDEYYQINNRVPLPDPSVFDVDGTSGLSSEEQIAFESALDEARERRELAGIDRYMNSSIMEYTAQWYERVHSQAGRYDFAAVNFGYGDLVELYDNRAGRPVSQITPINTERVWVKYYHGGEVCSADSDCPFNSAGARSSELTDINFSADLVQGCSALPQGASAGSVCSNFDDDAAALIGGPSSTSRYVPVNYRFCSDERVGTIGWCHRFDEGDSYREMVRNVAEAYERQYIFTNFRRYQSDFSIGAYLTDRLVGRQFTILQSVFQNLLFRYQTDSAFRTDTDAFGFYDQFMASADVLNFFARILGQPDVGSYDVDPVTGNFERLSSRPGVAGSMLDLSIGLGRYFSSTYQRGLTGITRIERIGSFYDKWFALQMLTQRGWQTDYTRDVPFWTNYYDLFPIEMQQIFQGMIQDRPESISPRITCEATGPFGECADPRLVYMDFYRGDCTNPATCRPDPISETYSGLDVVDGGSSVLLQYLAAVFSLSDFPIFHDTTFQNQLFICVDGQGDCFQPNDGAVEGEDFVKHTSSRFGKTFLAWQVEPTAAVPNQVSIGFKMVQEAANNQTAIGVIQKIADGESPTPAELDRLTSLGFRVPQSESEARADLRTLDFRQQDLESFFFQLIELERDFGIYNFLRF